MARLWGLPNHWAVIIEITSGFINVQFEANGVQVSDHTSMADAARTSLGNRDSKIRTSRYGRAHGGLNVGILNDYVEHLKAGRFQEYIFIFRDCQCFAREVVKYLTGKVVGAFPIENGPTFQPYS